MKTKLLIGLVFAAILTSCSNDDIIGINTDNIITFSPYVNKSTRTATEVDYDISKNNIGSFANGFSVYGYTAGSDGKYAQIFNDEAVKGNQTDGYKYDNIQYWEDGNTYAFHAIAPYGDDSETTETSAKTRHWKDVSISGDKKEIASLSFDNSTDQDLVYAYSNTSGKQVDFTFSHLLSRVRFKFQSANSNNTITIDVNDVTLHKAAKSAAITVDNGETDAIANANWTIDSGTQDIDFGGSITSYTDDGGSAYTNHKYLIPEDRATYTATVKLTIKSGSTDADVITKEEEIDLIPTTMEKGMSYEYVIQVDTSDAHKPIIFNVDVVKGWDSTWNEVKENYISGTLNVSSTATRADVATQIFGENFDLNNIKEVYIDGELKDKAKTYNLSEKTHDFRVVPIDDIENMSYMFNSPAITSLDFSKFDSSNVKYMFATFDGCSSLKTLDLSSFDTGNVDNMSATFMNCSSLTSLKLPSDLDTRKLKTMSYLFYGCSSLQSIDLSKFNTSNVENMNATFAYCSSLKSLKLPSNIDTSKVTNISWMFAGCSALPSIDLSKFNTSSVTDMSYMFIGCTSLSSLDLSKFNTGNVENMSCMFNSCTSLTSLTFPSNLDTKNVKDMSHMFHNCEALKSLDLTKFNTSSVTTMEDMFYYCKALTTLDLTGFTATNLTTARGMFHYCTSLETLKLTNFATTTTTALTDMAYMFYYCEKLTAIDDVSKFNTSNVTDMSNMFLGCSSLSSLDLSEFEVGKVNNTSYMFCNCSSLEKLDLSTFKTSEELNNMAYMFFNCAKLTSLDLSAFNTSNVTNMNCLFAGCNNLRYIKMMGDVSNVSDVTDMFSYVYSSGTFEYNSKYDYSKIKEALNAFIEVFSKTYGTTITWTVNAVAE